MSAATIEKGITVSGVVEDIEHKAGTGEYGPYDYYVLYVHTGRAVTEVRWDDNSEGPRPQTGETVHLLVNLPKGTRALPGRRRAFEPAHKG